MLTRPTQTASLVAAVLAVAAFSATAQDTPQRDMHQVAGQYRVAAAEPDADHEAAGQRFDNEAADYDKQAAEHKAMAKDYRNKARLNPKANYTALAEHCDRLVKSLKTSAAEARELAKLHHDIAKMPAN